MPRTAKGRKTKKKPVVIKNKVCEFTKQNIEYIDYKDVDVLKSFMSRGRIMPRRLSGVSAKYQRKLASAIKKSREAGLMPFIEK